MTDIPEEGGIPLAIIFANLVELPQGRPPQLLQKVPAAAAAAAAAAKPSFHSLFMVGCGHFYL